jgi:glutamate-1-semialdehyde 2,1-aminomutase
MFDIKTSLLFNKNLRQYLPGAANFNFRELAPSNPIRFSHGKGSRIWDLDGNEYVDLSCQFGAMILGHCDRQFNEALRVQIDRVINANNTDLELEVASRLGRLCTGMEKMRFSVTGTEAVMNALRLARAFAERPKFVRFEGHYHGHADHLIGGKAGGDGVPQQFAGDPFDTAGRTFERLQDESFVLPWNDIPRFEDLLSKHGDEIAAVIMEPACINGGGVLLDECFVKFVRGLCTDRGIVLIFDEIITGFRQYLGTRDWFGVLPDLRVIGKALGNGIPVSVFGGRAEILDLLERRKVVHGGTFNGHPLGLAAALATLKHLEKAGDEAYAKMAEHANAIKQLFANHAIDCGLQLHFLGTDKIIVLHAGSAAPKAEDYRRTDRMIETSILSNALAKHGVLTCPPSRLYLNLSFGADDLELLNSRLPAAFTSAANMMEKMKRAER